MNRKEDLEKFAKEWLSSWTGNNPDKLITYYADYCFYLDPFNKDGLKGTKEIFPYFSKILRKNPNWVWTMEELLPIKEGFIIIYYAIIPLKNDTVKLRGMDLVVLNTNMKIIRNEVFYDQSDILKIQAKF
jgi:hypothetical protein